MQAADEIIDIGPEAGTNGGNIVFQGKIDEMTKNNQNLTAQYLHNKLQIEVPNKQNMAQIGYC